MKKLQLLFLTSAFAFATLQLSAQRYLSEVFDEVQVTSSVVYGQNYTVMTGSPQMQPLVLDFYEPVGDELTERPLIIVVPTGSFLPRYFNNLPTGDKTDSATVEISKRFAKMGYVAAAIDYRKGWNPQASSEELRKESIIRAVYRAMQDTKTAVRFFRKEAAENDNPYGIDVNNIVLAGQGTGGYITFAYSTLQENEEIQLLKFYNFEDDAFMVDPDIMGDFEGFGGLPSLNNDNHPGYSTEIKAVFNAGGALGDASWQNAGEVPTISLHGVADAFAPYVEGTVFVPGTSFAVVDVVGSAVVARQSNELGNNDVLHDANLNDPITQRAQSALETVAEGYNDGDEGLFPIEGIANGNAPWEWWDEATVLQHATAMGIDGEIILANGYNANPVYQALGPVGGRARAMAYIDTIVGFVAPRLYHVLDLSSSVNEIDIAVEMFPNPATDYVNISTAGEIIDQIEIFDVNGKLMTSKAVRSNQHTLHRGDLPNGMYFLNLWFDGKRTTQKVIFR